MKRGPGGEGSGAGTQGVYRLATPVHRHDSQTRGVIAVHRLSMIKPNNRRQLTDNKSHRYYQSFDRQHLDKINYYFYHVY